MDGKIRWTKSIFNDFLKWFLLLSLIPIIILSILSYKNNLQTLDFTISNELEYSSSAYIGFIKNWFHYRKSDISLWSSQSNNIEFMKKLNTLFKEKKTYKKSKAYLSLINLYQKDLTNLTNGYDYVYDTLFIDTDGKILYSNRENSNLFINLTTGAYSTTKLSEKLKQSIKNKKIYFSDYEHYNPSNNKLFGFLIAPIIDNNKTIGLLAVQIKPQSLNKQLESINPKDNHITHYLLGAEDFTLKSSLGNLHNITTLKIQAQQIKIYKNEKNSGSHNRTHKLQSYLGQNDNVVIGKHQQIDIMGVKWLLVSEINKKIAYAPAYTLAKKIIFFTILITMLIIVAAFIVAKQITKPLKKLAIASNDIAHGKEKKGVVIDEDNEIGILADSFNDMIKKLGSSEKALYQRSQEAHQALRELQEQKFALDSHSIVAITDPKGNITYANKKFADISGYKISELIGKNHRILNSGKQPKEYWKRMYQIISKGEVWNDEICNRAKDGHLYWMDTTIVPFMDENNKPKSYIAIRTDITKQKENETKLIEAKEAAEMGAKAKAEFLASMSHEIRTPMNGVIGMLGLLQNSRLTKTQLHRLSLAQSSAQSLLSLINDILDFSKVEAGKLELELLEFNLRDELGDFAESIAFRAQEKDVELILDVKDIEHTQVVSDPNRLRQILNNLVGNSIKFTNKGEILITCKLITTDDTKGILYIDVKDSGIGIPEEKLHLLFDSFTQVDASTTRKYGGTGLGLSIVKRLTELMGGSISVKSELHKGSTFSFNIALDIKKDTPVVLPKSPIKGKRVLIVDDNAINRKVIQAQLEHWGMKAYEAKDGSEALQLCKEAKTPFDLMLIDMNMPNIDGMKLGKKLRADRTYEKMKLVMMTPLSTKSDTKRFIDIGFNAYFPKPATTKDLFHVLNVLNEDFNNSAESSNLIEENSIYETDENLDENSWPKNTKILLVEDNLTNQIVANGILETFNLETDIANNGEEAITMLKNAPANAPYTLVLMDCQMPILDGYSATEAIRQAKAGERNKNITIIAMTANAMKGDKEKCIISGMNDYLPKPIDSETFKQILLKWLKPKQKNHAD